MNKGLLRPATEGSQLDDRVQELRVRANVTQGIARTRKLAGSPETLQAVAKAVCLVYVQQATCEGPCRVGWASATTVCYAPALVLQEY
jgi:hypothetical protein